MEECEHILKIHDGTQWMYFTSKPHCEGKLYQALRNRGIPCYLPLLKKTTEYSHRVYTRQVPMFPGYVFASVCRMELDLASIGSCLARCCFLEEHQSEILLRDLITVQKYEVLAAQYKIRIVERFCIGETVTVSHGYFKGEKAVIRRLNPEREEVTVQLTALPMALSVELPADFLEKDA